MNMNVNGVTSNTPVYGATSAASANTTSEQKVTTDATTKPNDTGVVYEKSDAAAASTTKKTYKQNTTLINQLKADAEARTAQLKSLVEKLISGQGNAIGNASEDDSIWAFLRKGNFTVDAATKAQAQADIAEDGYWGIEQTSDRILDFAKALTGGDPDKIEEMKEAFKKGFKQAEETWGGELPEISKKTYDAVLEKFDAWAAENSKENETAIV